MQHGQRTPVPLRIPGRERPRVGVLAARKLLHRLSCPGCVEGFGSVGELPWENVLGSGVLVVCRVVEVWDSLVEVNSKGREEDGNFAWWREVVLGKHEGMGMDVVCEEDSFAIVGGQDIVQSFGVAVGVGF